MASPSDNVFAPPKSTVVDVPTGTDLQKASRGIRLLAKIIDGLAFTLGFIPTYVAVLPQMIHAGGPSPNAFAVWALMAQTGGRFYLGAGLVLVVCLLDILWVANNGQTVGKKVCGIKIVCSDGSRAGFWRIFLRRYLISSLLALIPVLGGLYALVDICFIFGGERRCVHDHFADTIVVRA